MNKDGLIVKQQLEIEELKESIDEIKEACRKAFLQLNHAEQWSPKCPDFPKVAMQAIAIAGREIGDV